jgi:hypothetical protein
MPVAGLGNLTIGGLFGGKEWALLNLDTMKEIVGQFVAQDVEETRGNTYAEAPVYRPEGPILQFIRREIDAFSFTTIFWSDSIFYEIDEKVDAVKSLMEVDPKAGRPPICLFACGDIGFSDNVIVKAVGGIKYAEPQAMGKIKGVTFSITVQRYIPFVLQTYDPTAVPLESMYHACGVGDTYEILAQKVYGEPLLGVYLRGKNPELAECEKDQLVKVPSKSRTLGYIAAPKGIIFDGAQESESALLDLFDRRAYSVTYPDIDGAGM